MACDFLDAAVGQGYREGPQVRRTLRRFHLRWAVIHEEGGEDADSDFLAVPEVVRLFEDAQAVVDGVGSAEAATFTAETGKKYGLNEALQCRARDLDLAGDLHRDVMCQKHMRARLSEVKEPMQPVTLLLRELKPDSTSNYAERASPKRVMRNGPGGSLITSLSTRTK